MGILSRILVMIRGPERIHALVHVVITGVVDNERVVLFEGPVPIEEWAKTKNDMVNYWQTIARSIEYEAHISGYYTDSGYYAQA